MIQEMDEGLSQQTLLAWVTVSQLLWWLVLFFALFSLPVLYHALICVLRRRRSHYFLFLVSMIVANLIMLTAICLNLILDYFFPSVKANVGSLLCKLTAFTTNSTACFVNWVWVMMYVQRCVYIFFPMRLVKSDGWLALIEDTRKILLVTGLMAIATQAWSPILMAEITLRNARGNIEGSFCGADATLVHEELFKWIAVAESMWTYALPFLITVISDLTVLVWYQRSTLTLVTAEHMLRPIGNAVSEDTSGLKIQSTRSIRSSIERRQRAIRRCLLMATVQLLLNLPNYVLQLLDEFFALRSSDSLSVLYIYCDAGFYLLYLLQFPMIAVYVYFLHSDDRERTNLSRMTSSDAHNERTNSILRR